LAGGKGGYGLPEDFRISSQERTTQRRVQISKARFRSDIGTRAVPQATNLTALRVIPVPGHGLGLEKTELNKGTFHTAALDPVACTVQGEPFKLKPGNSSRGGKKKDQEKEGGKVRRSWRVREGEKNAGGSRFP